MFFLLQHPGSPSVLSPTHPISEGWTVTLGLWGRVVGGWTGPKSLPAHLLHGADVLIVYSRGFHLPEEEKPNNNNNRISLSLHFPGYYICPEKRLLSLEGGLVKLNISRVVL